MRCGHDMRFGAHLEDGAVRFRLWAPAAREVALCWQSASGEWLSAAADFVGAGWWEQRVEGAGAGTLYRWRIDGELEVPDPASRHNPEGPHGPSCVWDPHSFEWDDGWQGRPWHETVLYELHVGSFTAQGTYQAAGERLAELAALGITAIELMPLASFPGRFGWGYDGVLPFAPQAGYGSPDDLKRFIQQAHRLGLMVFLDVVYNHFGPDGNYLHRYAPQFFSRTHQSPWGAAINFDGEHSRTVRDFFIANAVYWVEEFRIDGLRFDAVHAIVDDSRPHILEDISQAVRTAAQGRHVHLVLENEHNHWERLAPHPQPGRYDAQWNDDFHHALHVAMTGETQGYYHDYGDAPLDLLGRAFTHGMLFEAAPRKPGGAREQVRQAPAQPLATLVNCAHNHDQVGNRAHGERLSELVPPQARQLPTLLALLTPAIPMLFMGEEAGAREPFLYFADWQGELRRAVQQGRQREFGHVEQLGRPLPDPCSVDTFEASRPKSAADPVWQEGIRAALAARLRFVTPRQALLATGQHTSQRVGERCLAVQWRYSDGQVLSLELNLGPEPLPVPPQHLGPVQAQEVFRHNWPAGAAAGEWPPWSARWTLGAEITL